MVPSKPSEKKSLSPLRDSHKILTISVSSEDLNLKAQQKGSDNRWYNCVMDLRAEVLIWVEKLLEF